MESSNEKDYVRYIVLVINTINKNILPQKPPRVLSVLLQYSFTKLTWPTLVQYDVIQFLPSAGSETKLLSLKSNKKKKKNLITYITLVGFPIF